MFNIHKVFFCLFVLFLKISSRVGESCRGTAPEIPADCLRSRALCGNVLGHFTIKVAPYTKAMIQKSRSKTGKERYPETSQPAG